MLELILSAATASLMLCSAAYAGMPPASSQLCSSGLVQIKHQGGDDQGNWQRRGGGDWRDREPITTNRKAQRLVQDIAPDRTPYDHKLHTKIRGVRQLGKPILVGNLAQPGPEDSAGRIVLRVCLLLPDPAVVPVR